MAEYLISCVNGDHAHVKLKGLFVIKTLAYRSSYWILFPFLSSSSSILTRP